ncbi:AAA family ATPase [Mesorhizobium ventifaucium]|uniref:DNA repair protein RadA n=1 Tax=Mesorhizobium ventifaucium TaxID=666020 RepID=A0ABM9ECX9_9HYPH|nr:AAA family ATPase [Mesorhizobium ventifaucium]CAH2406654.1 DNA repair protein RadA [Mesorhizobium ventifaucium]
MHPSDTNSPDAAQVPNSNSDCISQADDDISDLLGYETVPHIATNLAVALDLAKRGFAVFPCREYGPKGVIKSPYTEHGKDDASTDLDFIRRWWLHHPKAIVGLPCRRNGLAVLDLDRHRADQDGIEALRGLGYDPDTTSPFTVDTAADGRHLYFQPRDGLSDSSEHLPDGIDIKYNGYVIAAGSTMADGRRYHTGAGPLALERLPAWPAALLPPKRNDFDLTRLLGPDPMPVDWSEVKRALVYVDPDCSRDEWMRIGMAIHAGSDGSQEAFELWDGWSSKATEPGKYNRREMVGQWRSFGRRDGINIDTLFYIATECGWTRGLDISADDFDDLGEQKLKPDATPSRLTFLSPSDCEAAPSRGYLIKGLFAPGDVACIFGAPGAGKSLLAPRLGYAVAQGTETFGMRSKQGSVFYVAAEDPQGMPGRVKALRKAHGEAEDFQLVEGVSNLLADKSPDLVALVAVVKERRPALIFIDTLAMAFPGLEENDAKSMGRVVAVARLLASWGAAVVLIHHDTKAEGATPRGHSLLNGALDVALHVKRDENGVIRGKLTKNRNGTCERDIAFKIAVEDGGTDEDGDTVTLPRCFELMGAAKKTDERLSASVKAALDILDTLGGGTTEKAWREACAEGRTVSAAEDRESRVRAFKRAAERLIRSHHVEFANGRYRIPCGFDDCEDET